MIRARRLSRTFTQAMALSSVAYGAFAEPVTWRVPNPNTPTPAAVTLPAGQVVLTRVAPPPGMSAEELAQTLAQQQARLDELARLQAQAAEASREYAKLQAQLAQERAAKEAIATSLQATQAQIQSETAATEARLREESQRRLADVQQLTNVRLRGLEELAGEKIDNVKALTTSQLESLAQTTQRELAHTREQTAQQMGELKTIANLRLEKQDTLMQSQLAQQNEKLEQVKTLTATQLESLAQTTQRELAHTREQTAQQMGELKTIANLRLDKQEALMQTQLSALQETTRQQLAQQNDMMNARLAALQSLTDANRQLATLQTERLAETLRAYADEQLASTREAFQQALEQTAQSQQLATLDLASATAEQLANLYTQANAQAARMVEAQALKATEDIAALARTVDAQKLTPAQVEVIAAQTVADAAPEFKALALSTLKDAKDYLTTIARSAVADGDSGMQQALAQAVGRALAEEASPAAFSMRRAILNELTLAAQEALSPTVPTAPEAIRLGEAALAEIEPAAGPTEHIQAERLALGRLLAPAAGPVAVAPALESGSMQVASLQRARSRTDLMDLRDYKVVVHEDNQTLPDMLERIVKRAEPFTGPWQVRWKLKAENQDIMTERFSLDAETTFNEFVSYLAQFLLNDRGVKLTFSLFDRERVVLVSDQ